MNSLIMVVANNGLAGVQDNLVSNWVGPAFLIVVAVIAVKFVVSRQFRELAGFLAIAAIVALLVFNADSLFGSEGIFKGIADSFARLIGGGSSGDTASSVPRGGVIQILRFFR